MPLRPVFPGWRPAIWALIAWAFLALSIGTDSLDMQESQTWDYARLDSFSTFCKELQQDQSPEANMPVGMFAFWAWSRMSGTGEAAMRTLNLVWIAIALLAFARLGRRLAIPWLPMLLAVQPFVWYYMNFARTPVMQMAGGALLLAGLLDYLPVPPHRAAPSAGRPAPLNGAGGILLCLGAILLSGASVLGMVPLAAVVIGLTAHGAWNSMHMRFRDKALLFLTAALVALLALYYALTLLRAGQGAPLWAVSPANLFFVAYEFLGFQGLGPARQDIRLIVRGINPVRDFLPYLPGLLALAAAYLVALAAAYKSWMTRAIPIPAPNQPAGEDGPRSVFVQVWMLGLGVPLQCAVILLMIAYLGSFPFWGHHLAGTFPFWVAALAVTLRWANQGLWRKAGRYAGWLLLGLLICSSLLLRFSPVHSHDDYRGAAAEAARLASAGHRVWWVADHSGGNYYGLQFGTPPAGGPGTVEFAMNAEIPTASLPDVIILSRPDIFDARVAARTLLASGAYRHERALQSFDVWIRRSDTAPAR